MNPRASPGLKFGRRAAEYLLSAFGGIVRQTNFTSPCSENLSLTNKHLLISSADHFYRELSRCITLR